MEEKVLLNVEINDSDALKAIVQLQEQVAKLRAEQKNLDRSTENGNKRYHELNEQIKALNSRTRERSKQIQNEITMLNKQGNSLNALRAEYNELKKRWGDMELGSQQFKEATIRLDELDSQILEAEKAVGDFRRQVGNYAIAGKEVAQVIKENTERLLEMRIAGEENTEEFQNLVQETAKLKETIKNTQQQINMYSSGTGKIEGVVQGLNAAVASATLLCQGLSALGVKDKDVKAVADNMQKLVGIMKALEIVQKAVNKAALANPYAIVAAAIAILIAAIVKLVKYFSKEEQASRAAAKAEEAYQKQKEKTARLVGRLNDVMDNEIARREIDLQKRIRQLRKEGATEEEIATLIAENEVKATNLRINAGQQWVKQKKRELALLQDQIKEQRKLAKATEKEEKRAEAYEKLNQLKADEAKLVREINQRIAENIRLENERDAKRNTQNATPETPNPTPKTQNPKTDTPTPEQQLAELQKHAQDALKLLHLTADEEIDAVKHKYAEAEQALTDYFDIMQAEYDELAERRGDLNAPLGADREPLTAEEQARMQELEAMLLTYYDQKRRLAEQSEQEVAAIRKREADAEQQRIDDENAAKLKAINDAMQQELAAVQGEVDKEYQIKMNALQQELEQKLISEEQYQQRSVELSEEAAQKKAEIAQRTMQQYTAKMQEASSAAMGTLQAADQLWSSIEDRQLAEYESNNEKKHKALQDRLDRGLISQEEYDKGVAAADAQLDKEKRKIERQQAIRQKALNIMQATMNTAMAITKTLAELGATPWGLAMIGMAAATGAMQIAAIAAEPLPKASKGALLQGPSHAEGGIIIEAEGGEAIINKKSTAKYRDLLSAINADGGGVRFADGGVVGGKVLGGSSTVGGLGRDTMPCVSTASSNDLSNRDLLAAIKDLKIYTAVTDIHRVESQMATIESMRN